ncbi:phospholipid scramblase 1-like [Pollicipes pollicipes]|uniref:phospholipid scramblase 1-like n=1 Tax=Pollicipes pollicipes TaxID=41117 RepID=UPI001884D028|nr:phospholipid scramblase 1-like [Pollicipes pollicipes]
MRENEPDHCAVPTGMPGCPAGLEYLMRVDQLLVQQRVELLEALTGFETANKYTITDRLGQQLYVAVEDSECCARYCCGPGRPFDIRVTDVTRREVLRLERPLRCQGCLCPQAWLQRLEAYSGPAPLGSVRQNWSVCTSSFDVLSADGDAVLAIEGPACACSLCGDVAFRVLTADGRRPVGEITKQWGGLVREAFTDADTFGVSFPTDLDVKVKATLLGATFLIDYMFFEKG